MGLGACKGVSGKIPNPLIRTLKGSHDSHRILSSGVGP